MISSLSHRRSIIILLGFLTALGPFTLDMYLPAFPAIAADLHTTTAALAFTLSSDFIGIGIGQLLYGSLLDRFGRKKPLYVGLVIYFVASLACMSSHTLQQMIMWRFIVGLGGCVAGVVSYVVIRDIFALEERGKVFSMVILVMGASPLFAPSVGNLLTLFVGWRFLFLALALISFSLILAAWFILPSTVNPNKAVRLHPWQMAHDYWMIATTPHFYVYGLCGASAFAALFAYVSGSPILFLKNFHLSTTTFSWIFTFIAAGFILSSQCNIWLLKHFKSFSILRGALLLQGTLTLFFLVISLFHLLSLPMAIILLFLLMGLVSIIFSNASVLAIEPFGVNAGRASAFISFSQMLFGTISSMSVGFLGERSFLVLPGAMLMASLLALFFFFKNKNLCTSSVDGV